jgi:hypothetical protein
MLSSGKALLEVFRKMPLPRSVHAQTRARQTSLRKAERYKLETTFPKNRIPARLAFFFSNCLHNSGSHLPRFLMAIMRVEVGAHPQQNFVRSFSGLGFRDEQPTAGATCTFDWFPLLHRLEKLKGSGLAHAPVSHTKGDSERSSSD